MVRPSRDEGRAHGSVGYASSPMIEERLIALVTEALAEVARELGLEGDLPEVELTKPRQKEHGDFATNVALVLAPRVGRSPRDVAELLLRHLPEASFVRSAEVAGPGFINFRLTTDWLTDALRDVAGAGRGVRPRRPERPARAGRVRERQPDRAAPHRPRAQRRARRRARPGARGGRVVGRARVLLQRHRRADGSVRRVGRGEVPPAPGPRGRGARGRVPRRLRDRPRPPDPRDGRSGPGRPAARRSASRGSSRRARACVLEQIDATLERFGVRFDSFMHERVLADKGLIDAAVQRLRDAGYAYDAEGAVWFRSTAFGDDKDRPLVRSNGTHTYFGADCAYLIDKFERGFDHLVYVWGADHHGDVARVRGAAQALGYDAERRRDRDLPMGLVPARRGAGPDEQARGHVRQPRRADRRGRHGRGAVPPADVQQRRDDEVRHRDGEAADAREPRLLRPVRTRPHRIDPAKGDRTRDRDPADRTDRPGPARTRGRARRAARGRRRPVPDRDRRRAAGAAPAHATPRRTSRRASTASTPSARSCPTTTSSRRHGCGSAAEPSRRSRTCSACSACPRPSRWSAPMPRELRARAGATY